MIPRASRVLGVPIFLVAALLPIASAGQRPAGNWPSFRGPQASGIAEGHALPVAWDGATGKNLKWKTGLPGLGHGSPVIWRDRLFVTTAYGSKDDELRVGLYGEIAPVEDDSVRVWRLYCLDKNSGRVLWERTLHEGVPRIQRHTKATHANSTAATDGRYVAVLLGSEGLHVYTVKGKPVWKKDLGLLDSGYHRVPAAQWGFGSSPVIHGDKLIVQCDVQSGSFVAAYDLATGRELWRTERDEVPTWSTPSVFDAGGRSQVVVNGHRHIGGYDLASGKSLWRLRGAGDIPVPTPILAHDLIFITSAHGGGAPIFAIRPDAVGDVSLADAESSSGAVAWSESRAGAYMQTPLVYGEFLYVCRDNGVLSCYEAKTGREVYKVRLGAGSNGFTASAVAGDGKLYFTDELGDTHVLAAGAEFEELARNSLGEIVMATPAISAGTLFFRTKDHVVAVVEPAPRARGRGGRGP